MLAKLPCNVALVRLQGGLDNPCDVRYLEQVGTCQNMCSEHGVDFQPGKKKERPSYKSGKNGYTTT